MRRFISPVFVLLALTLTIGTAAAKVQCPKVSKTPKVYAIGSSTMGSALGKILKKHLGSAGAEVRVWGKASSGLARPDFHDWPAKVPAIVKRHQPDIFVVSLGTNDGQPLWHAKRWYGFGTDRWKKIYAERVDRILKELAGPKGRRTVVWIGPTAHPGRTFTGRMKVINGILAARIAAFDGPAYFVDGLKKTLSKDGRIVKKLRIPGTRKDVDATQSDGVHLTVAGVRWLLAEPILQKLKPCISSAPRKNAGARTASKTGKSG